MLRSACSVRTLRVGPAIWLGLSLDNALQRVIVQLMKDDTELFKQFMDNESFKRWICETVFEMTYYDVA